MLLMLSDSQPDCLLQLYITTLQLGNNPNSKLPTQLLAWPHGMSPSLPRAPLMPLLLYVHPPTSPVHQPTYQTPPPPRLASYTPPRLQPHTPPP
jgi:hypothetical protein